MARRLIMCVEIDWDERETLQKFCGLSWEGLRNKVSYKEVHELMKDSKGYQLNLADWNKLFFVGDGTSNVRYYPVVDDHIRFSEWYFYVKNPSL